MILFKWNFLPSTDVSLSLVSTAVLAQTQISDQRNQIAADQLFRERWVQYQQNIFDAALHFWKQARSLYQEPDAPTTEVMVDFYKKLGEGKDKAQALRQAMLTDKYPNPRDWVAFTLIGEAQ